MRGLAEAARLLWPPPLPAAKVSGAAVRALLGPAVLAAVLVVHLLARSGPRELDGGGSAAAVADGLPLPVARDDGPEPSGHAAAVVRDAVAFDEQLLLFTGGSPRLQRRGGNGGACLFNGRVETALIAVDGHVARCEHPPAELRLGLVAKPVTLVASNGTRLSTSAAYPVDPGWQRLVYEAVPVDGDLLVFAKGVVASRAQKRTPVEDLRCVFGAVASTAASEACYEGVRCKLPPGLPFHRLRVCKVSLRVRGRLLPSVVYFDDLQAFQRDRVELARKRWHLCACTMVWNKARFLHEWVAYHSYLGVESFFFYDNNRQAHLSFFDGGSACCNFCWWSWLIVIRPDGNNGCSDDGLLDALDVLAETGYNVSRRPWPWLKTQEAGFSHCALHAEPDCTWMLYTDVDEFVYPRAALGEPGRPALHLILERSVSMTSGGGPVGAVQLLCYDFGPSGLKSQLPGGQVISYTCRDRKPQRHKSIVLLEAMDGTRCGAIHHFDLKEGYEYVRWRKALVVINHYKFPAWDDFKQKFLRRVATYVTDWGEKSDLQSSDRVEGLGTEPVEPTDWRFQHCQENDTGLRDFFIATFLKAGGRFPWQ
eukprot:SM000165S02201  [mRNA]  locus=s165:108090:110191:- [translate_table: standard]